ncbi:hypothetical protein ACO0LG_19490 [Undibacterium sp. Ji42W]|uniref:hypothetical protein n=1 Tax=Undibacterium sp. Ji42W TaxID=3413039 RepID=UPI003BEFD1BF
MPVLIHLSGKWQGSNTENRVLASAPVLPANMADVLKFPALADAYLNDHFGLRNNLVAWNNSLRYHLLGDVNAVQLTAGKDGFIFFNSHAANAPLSMVHFLCGKNVSVQDRAGMVETASRFMQTALQLKADSYLLMVPTKPVVYAEKMPDWVQRQCQLYTPTLPGVIARLNEEPALAGRVIYPLPEMHALKARGEVYPKNTFHWTGMGPQPVAQWLSETYFKHPRLTSLTGKMHDVPSDIQQFLPGVTLNVPTRDVDYALAGIHACEGVACFPEWKGVAAALGDVSRFSRLKKQGPRLLLISDSFGHGIAGFFSEYYGEVWHLSMNSINLLPEAERARLKKIVFEDFAPDQVLYVFHDAAISYFERAPSLLLNAKD